MTLFSDLWSCFTLSTWWCQLGAVKWTIPNRNRENKPRLHDVHIRGAHIQAGSERRGLVTSLSISHPGVGEQGGLPWPPAHEGFGVTGPHRTLSLSFIALVSVSNYAFLCVTVWLRSVSPLWLWAPWEQRPCPLLFTMVPQVHWQCLAHGKWSIFVDWLPQLHFINFLPQDYQKVSESTRFL